VRQQTPEYKARNRARKQTPEYKAKAKARAQTPEYKAWNWARRQTTEYKAKARVYNRAWNQQRLHSPKGRAYLNILDHRRRTRKTSAGGSFTPAEWQALCARYNLRCLACGKRRKLTADHVISVKNGGSSNIDNIQPLCGPCNSSKNSHNTNYRKHPHPACSVTAS